MTDVMTLRLGSELLNELDTLSQAEEKDRSTVVRELLEAGLHERKIAKALKQYQNGQITLWKAARLAQVSLWRMIELLREHSIDAQYGMHELRKDFTSLKKE